MKFAHKLQSRNFNFPLLGWNEGSEKYSVLAETEESRNKFADNALKFIVFYGFDGVRRGKLMSIESDIFHPIFPLWIVLTLDRHR